MNILKPADLDSEAENTNNPYFLTNSDFKDYQSSLNGTTKLDKRNFDHMVTEESKVGNIKSISPQLTKSLWSPSSSNQNRYYGNATESSCYGLGENNAVLRTETDVQGDQVYGDFNDYLVKMMVKEKGCIMTPECASKHFKMEMIKDWKHQGQSHAQSLKDFN